MNAGHYVLLPIDGLRLTCDFQVYSAALFGYGPNYRPSRTLTHKKFEHPYVHLGVFRIRDLMLPEYAELLNIDEVSQQQLLRLTENVPDWRLSDSTCLAFEFEEADLPLDGVWSTDAESNEKLVRVVLDRAERILDVLRLYIFQPGRELLIGMAGGLGYGSCGFWIGNEDRMKFLARNLTPYHLSRDPVELSLEDVRRIYADRTFIEICTAACSNRYKSDKLMARIFEALRGYRQSRDLQHPEARFRHLAAIAESLARRDPSVRLSGNDLRTSISKIASYNWKRFDNQPCEREKVPDLVSDLWTNVRNTLAHTPTTFEELGRRTPDVANMETLVVTMIHSLVWAWRLEEFHKINPYDIISTGRA